MKIKHAEFGLVAKNIKVFDTDDGYAWNASFYLDGKKIGTAGNQGHGGETNTRGIDADALKKIETYAASLPPDTSFGVSINLSAECVLDENAMSTDSFKDILKKTKAKLKKQVIAKGDTEGSLRVWKVPAGMTIEDVTGELRRRSKKEMVFLNEMQPETAMDFLYSVE